MSKGINKEDERMNMTLHTIRNLPRKEKLAFLGIAVLIALTLGSYMLEVYKITFVCVLIWAALAAILNATASMEEMKYAEKDVQDNGVDWAVKELVLYHSMHAARKDGLKRGIRNYKEDKEDGK